MKLKELRKLFADMTDDELDIDEILKGSEDISKIFNNPLTLDKVKAFIKNNNEGQQYLQSYGDKRVTEGIKTWKDKNLQTIINDEVLKATGKKKSPEQIQIEELQKKFETQEKENTRLKNESTLKTMLSDAGFEPSKTLEFFNVNDMENVETRISNLKALIDEKTQAGIKEAISSGSYVPPGENGSADITVDDIAKMRM